MRISAFTLQNIMEPHIKPCNNGFIVPALYNSQLDNEWHFDGRFIYQEPNGLLPIIKEIKRKYKLPKSAKVDKMNNPILPLRLTFKGGDILYAQDGRPEWA